jgi:hypothetical protein
VRLPGIFCANAAGSVDDFLEYDWLGAPWAEERNREGGNGGLSLRRVSAITQLLHAQRWIRDRDMPEDVWFSDKLFHRPGARNAAHEVRMHFSGETLRSEGFKPLGYHSGDGGTNHLPRIMGSMKHRQALWDYCPEFKSSFSNLEAEYFIGDICHPEW